MPNFDTHIRVCGQLRVSGRPEAFGNATIGNWFILFPSTVCCGLGWIFQWAVAFREFSN